VTHDVDVVVVGGGINGVATLRALARSGVRTTLVERFGIGHDRGSSHGASRIFRLAYPEPGYAELARESLAGWRELETECGETLIVHSGSLDTGDEAVVTLRSLVELGIRHDLLSGAEAAQRWPVTFDPGSEVVFQPDGGYTRADRAHAALLASAAMSGATVAEGEPVERIEIEADGVVLVTGARRLTAGAVVVAAGAWARGLLAPLGIDLPVAVTRETVAYYELTNGSAPDTLPSLIEYPSATSPLPEGQAYYALAAPGVGLKAGVHHSGAAADPDAPATPDAGVVDATSAWVSRRYPGIVPVPVHTETCLYTNTPDEGFVVEAHGRVVVASACSGHGFKFAPAHGARAAALALEAGA
jgi:sarcosine oxidase